ncbi:MAG: ABC transporter permease, partial [Pseudomonadota bacterium]
MTRNALPVLTVLAALIGLWYASVAPMNIRVALDQVERGGAVVEPATSAARRGVSAWRLMSANSEYISVGYALERPRLPTPTQVGRELWKTTGEMAMRGRAFSKRSLIWHGWLTLQSTIMGFLLGTAI